jgi:hypothetical protein
MKTSAVLFKKSFITSPQSLVVMTGPHTVHAHIPMKATHGSVRFLALQRRSVKVLKLNSA